MFKVMAHNELRKSAQASAMDEPDSTKFHQNDKVCSGYYSHVYCDGFFTNQGSLLKVSRVQLFLPRTSEPSAAYLVLSLNQVRTTSGSNDSILEPLLGAVSAQRVQG